MLPDGPPPEKDHVGINSTGFLFLAVVVSFWIARRVDRCRTDSPRDAPRRGGGGRILRKDTAGAATEVIQRDATESIAKTTKHLHTGHQTTSVTTYLSCATSFAGAPPPLEDIRTEFKKLHHDDTVVFMEISSIDCTVRAVAG